MLFLSFQIGNDRYGLEAGVVAEVLALVNLKTIPQGPSGIAGIFSYHGTLVPVVDLSEVALGRPSESRLSTRIILVNTPIQSEKTRFLGLMAERVTETIQLDPASFKEMGVEAPEAPYLGPVARDSRGLIQWIKPEKILPDALRESLFLQQPGEPH